MLSIKHPFPFKEISPCGHGSLSKEGREQLQKEDLIFLLSLRSLVLSLSSYYYRLQPRNYLKSNPAHRSRKFMNGDSLRSRSCLPHLLHVIISRCSHPATAACVMESLVRQLTTMTSKHGSWRHISGDHSHTFYELAARDVLALHEDNHQQRCLSFALHGHLRHMVSTPTGELLL